MFNVVRFEQPINAPPSISVTVFGITILGRLEHSPNASLPIFFNVVPRETETSSVHS
jgi:hypothetical protein